MSKRIVFLDPQGPPQILGVWAGPEPLPVTTAAAFPTSTGRVVPFASLVRVTRCAAYYKEPLTPAPYGSFHAEQR